MNWNARGVNGVFCLYKRVKGVLKEIFNASGFYATIPAKSGEPPNKVRPGKSWHQQFSKASLPILIFLEQILDASLTLSSAFLWQNCRRAVSSIRSDTNATKTQNTFQKKKLQPSTRLYKTYGKMCSWICWRHCLSGVLPLYPSIFVF